MTELKLKKKKLLGASGAGAKVQEIISEFCLKAPRFVLEQSALGVGLSSSSRRRKAVLKCSKMPKNAYHLRPADTLLSFCKPPFPAGNRFMALFKAYWWKGTDEQHPVQLAALVNPSQPQNLPQ